MKIKFINEAKSYKTEIFKKKILDLFEKIGVNDVFNIIFLTGPMIKDINKGFRGKDYITDVLSFSDNDIENKKYIGDIFICLSQAKKQAKKIQQPFEKEVTFLAVHGYLHLKGYDHLTSKDEKAMIKQQQLLMGLYEEEPNKEKI